MTEHQLRALAFRTARKAGQSVDNARVTADHICHVARLADHGKFRRFRRHIIAEHSAEYLINDELRKLNLPER